MLKKIRKYLIQRKEQKENDERELAIATYCAYHDCSKCRYADSLLNCSIEEKFGK